jgi:hypothetical protein
MAALQVMMHHLIVHHLMASLKVMMHIPREIMATIVNRSTGAETKESKLWIVTTGIVTTGIMTTGIMTTGSTQPGSNA